MLGAAGGGAMASEDAAAAIGADGGKGVGVVGLAAESVGGVGTAHVAALAPAAGGATSPGISTETAQAWGPDEDSINARHDNGAATRDLLLIQKLYQRGIEAARVGMPIPVGNRSDARTFLFFVRCPGMRIYAGALGAIVVFGALAQGAHDLWAATLVHVAALATWAALVLGLCWPRRGPGIPARPLVPLAGVALVFALSFLQSVHPEESRLALTDFLAAALVFLAAQCVFRDQRGIDGLLKGAAVLVCVEEAVILRQHWLLTQAENAPRGARALALYLASLQVPGTLVNSSVATAFFLLWVPPLGARVWEELRRGRRPPPLLTAGFAGAVLGVLSLDSTWGLVCLALAAPLIPGARTLLSALRRRPGRAAAAGAAGAAAFAALIAWKFGHAYNLTGRPLDPGETTRRVYWWASGWRMFRDHPWLGVGLGNFPSAYQAYKVGAVQNTLYPHDSVVGLLAETGLLGAASVAAFLWSTLSRRAARGPDAERREPFLLGLAAFALFGLLGLSVEYLANLVCAALFLGVAVGPTPGRRWKPGKPELIVLTAACVCALPFLVAPFLASRAAVDARQQLEAGDADGAARRFAAAAELDPRSSDARRGWARALEARAAARHDAEDLARAAVQQREAARLNRLQGVLWWELGRDLQALGRRGEALASYEAAARLDSGSARFRADRDALRAAASPR